MHTQGLAAAAVVMTLSVPAFAQKAFTREKVSVSGRVEYGFNLQAGTLNPYALGLGARAGYTLNNGLYFGGNGEVFLGVEKTILRNTIDANHFQILGEVGYDLALVTDNLVLRPLGALGLAQHTVGFCFAENGTCGRNSGAGFVLGAGANLMYGFGRFLIGVDTRVNWLVGDADENTSLILGIGAGATF